MQEVGERWGGAMRRVATKNRRTGPLLGWGSTSGGMGRWPPFVLQGGEKGRAEIASDMKSMGGLFVQQLAGRGVGFEEMLLRQGELWRSRQQASRGMRAHTPSAGT
eukprot:5643609-Prymnesium_polylepis.1